MKACTLCNGRCNRWNNAERCRCGGAWQKVQRFGPLLERESLSQHRDRVYDNVADAVSGAIRRTPDGDNAYVSYKELGRRLGREMGRTLFQITKGKTDTSVSTLADLALATGHTLHIEFRR